MAETDLEVLILDLLFNTNRELRLKEIEEALLPIARRQDRFLTEERFHVQVIRRLNKFIKYEWVQKRTVSHKNRLYSIKNVDYVRLILSARTIGLDLTSNPRSLKLPIVLSSKTYEALVQSLSEILLAIIFRRKDFIKHVHSRTRLPGVLVCGFPIPISQEKGNVLKDKILIFAPDEISATRVRDFTEEQYEDFVRYLSLAWTLYFEERKVAHGDTVIIHFTKQRAERLRRIVEIGKAKSVDEIVSLAVSNYLDAYDPSKKLIEIEMDSPAIRMAIEKGWYKDKREFIETAVNEQKRRVAQRLYETTK